MKKLTFTAIAALAAMLLALAPTAMARGDDDRVIKQGSCSASSTWKLKVKSDDGQLETEFEVDQNRVGKRWRVTIKRDGNVAFRGIRTTRAPSGSFSVERRLANSPGSDRIVASAKALQSGETCRAVINF
ncbi:MAG TPA: hypothetical protein VFR63_11800 [Gaiellaceae bacterium]|nr:hypothetical protein [Gaiellaceae bacterium]